MALMNYIKWGEGLPLGGESRYYVFMGTVGLISCGPREKEVKMVEYRELVNVLKGGDDSGVKKYLEHMLGLEGDELDVVCERLLAERNKGQWDKVPKF